MNTNQNFHQAQKPRPYVVSVTSGKGGVGKTLTTVNLAIAARKMGRSVLIFDGDLGLANVDVVLGLQPRYNIRDVLDGNARLKDIVMEGPLGIRVIPSGSGISSLAQLSFVQRQQLMEQIETLDIPVDILLIDTGAGISENVLHLNSGADRVIVVTSAEPHAMTDAYAIIKVLAEEHQRKQFDLLVNQVRSTEEGLRVSDRIKEVAKRFLDIDVGFLGAVPYDPQIQKSIMQRRAASEQSAHTLAGQAWNRIARSVFSHSDVQVLEGDVQDMWQNLICSPPVTALGSTF